MNELNQAFEDYFLNSNKINCVLLYLSNERRAKIMIYDRSD